MDQWFIGTMGFSYKDWKGPFYPVDLVTRNYLHHYSRIFNAVEIDSTFYGTPKADYVQRWAAATPDGFQFCLKVPRAITHDLGLQAAQGLMQEFLDVVRLLGSKLGVILFQFPPSFKSDQFAALESFLAEIARDVRFAVEFRHASWHAASEKVAQMLAEKHVCWAATDYPGLPRRISPTAGFIYVRWIGRHGSYHSHSFERVDRTPELKEWHDLIQSAADQVESVYGFMNNDYAGFAPATASRFKAIAGLETGAIQPYEQKKLF